jgi:hypothetical protein
MSAIIVLEGDFGYGHNEIKHIVIPQILHIHIERPYENTEGKGWVVITMLNSNSLTYARDDPDNLVEQIVNQINDFYKNYNMYVEVLKK